jgi:hypothetical protein
MFRLQLPAAASGLIVAAASFGLALGIPAVTHAQQMCIYPGMPESWTTTTSDGVLTSWLSTDPTTGQPIVNTQYPDGSVVTETIGYCGPSAEYLPAPTYVYAVPPGDTVHCDEREHRFWDEQHRVEQQQHGGDTQHQDQHTAR